MKLNEIFLSLQGEGIYIGLPTVFIRFSGCNLDCKWCDTEYAKEEGEEYTLEQVMDELQDKYPHCSRVCITGGEPMCQPDDTGALLHSLLDRKFQVVLETNGSLDLAPISDLAKDPQLILAVDVKTPSSGEQDSFNKANLGIITEKSMLKFVIADDADYEFSKTFLLDLKPKCNIIFTAEGGTDLPWLAKKIIEDKLDVRLLPQLHKLIWGPDARGV